MKEKLQKISQKVRFAGETWFRQYGTKTLLFLGALVALSLSFEGGFLVGRDRAVEPIIVSTPVVPTVAADTDTVSDESEKATGASDTAVSTREKEPLRNSPERSVSEIPAATGNTEACVFVGSRNSDKYHLPKCSWAKRIKPENRICFASAADAEARGYHAGCVK